MGHLYHGYVTNNQRIFIFAQSPEKSVVKKTVPFGVKVRIFGGNTGKPGYQTAPLGRSQGNFKLDKLG